MNDTQTEIKYDLENTHGYASGAQTCLYLIPSQESSDGKIEIYMFVNIGPGTPMMAWNRRWFCLGSVGTECEPDSLQNALTAYEDEFREIDAAYRGATWNGSNLIGQWDQDAVCEESWQRISMEARENCDQYWDASDWFHGSLNDIDLTLETITAIAKYESETADGAVLDVDDCERFLRNAITNRAEEIEEIINSATLDDDYREDLETEIANLRRLLAA